MARTGEGIGAEGSSIAHFLFLFFFGLRTNSGPAFFPPPHPTTNKRCVLRIQRAKNKVVLLLLSEWAVEKQQLQYNLMGNKFPFLLSTWPPATNPRAWRVVNFHGKVVNFHKQQPFLCFRRLSHRHLYFLQKGARDVLNMTQHEKAGKVLDVEMWEYSVGLSWMWLHLVFPPFFFSIWQQGLCSFLLFSVVFSAHLITLIRRN